MFSFLLFPHFFFIFYHLFNISFIISSCFPFLFSLCHFSCIFSVNSLLYFSSFYFSCPTISFFFLLSFVFDIISLLFLCYLFSVLNIFYFVHIISHFLPHYLFHNHFLFSTHIQFLLNEITDLKSPRDRPSLTKVPFLITMNLQGISWLPNSVCNSRVIIFTDSNCDHYCTLMIETLEWQAAQYSTSGRIVMEESWMIFIDNYDIWYNFK